jgi:DNA invertase Pin-like site-specific DNA recombinase
MKIGYARCSTVGQDTEIQQKTLRELGVDQDRIYVDHGFTGKTMTREGFEKALAACREGDEFIVPSMDRLARNAEGTLAIMRDLGERHITLRVGDTVYNPRDPMAKLFFTMLAAVAEAEGGWISIRTKEAMARPSVRIRLKGKPPKLSAKQHSIVAAHYERGDMGMQEIANMFNISRASAYRAVERHRSRQAEPTSAATNVETESAAS